MKALLFTLFLFAGLSVPIQAQSIIETVAFDAGGGIASGTSIQLLSFKLGVQQAGLLTQAGGGGGAGKSQFSPVTLFKTIDKTTPELFLACALGKVIKSATISAISDDGMSPPVTFFKIILKNVIVSSVNDDGSNSDGGTPFMETIALSYSQIDWKFTATDGTGSTQGAFDVKRNLMLPPSLFQ